LPDKFSFSLLFRNEGSVGHGHQRVRDSNH
jgi:hypothetical protein